ncbi:MAG: hypothetical protein NTX24_01745 [Candidatus Pacearchaeota archaeon]|nr:hypothetical protein [Candidatus Pacearchaeota archaeon]
MKSIVNKLGEVAKTVKEGAVNVVQSIYRKPVQTAVALAAAYVLSGCAPTIVYQDRLVPYAVPTPVPAQVQSNQAIVEGDNNLVIQGNLIGAAPTSVYEFKKGELKKIPCGTPDGK